MSVTAVVADYANPAAEWQAWSVRFTAFLLTPPELPKIEWWQQLVESAPESRTVRVGAGELIEQGIWEKHALQLQIHLARVDWILTPRDEPGSATFPSLGALRDSIGEFRNLMSKWLDVAHELNRLALGVQLIIPTADRAQAMRYVAGMLPHVRLNWEAIRDFMFRVNRPRRSVAWPELGELNRLGTWAAISRKKMVAALLPESQSLTPVVEEFAAFLELDINTPAIDAKADVARDLRRSLLDELISNALEIAERGDFE